MRTVKQLAQLYFTAKGMHRLEKQAIVSLKNIAISFDGEPVLKDFSLDIGDREFVTLLGPSGCGKTTTLRIIGGFTRPDSGDVFFKGRKITNLPPHKREVNTIFQKYALFPHLNVYDNVAFGMRVHGKSEREIKSKVSEMLSMVNLQGFEHRGVNQLSGGEQQRVAIARALAKNPKLLLCDEPTGALDYKTGKSILKLLQDTCRDNGKTVVIITHNSALEAIGDRVIRINSGTVTEIRENPNPMPAEKVEW